LRDQEGQLKERAATIGAATITSAEDYQAVADDLARFMEEENEIGKANLGTIYLASAPRAHGARSVLEARPRKAIQT